MLRANVLLVALAASALVSTACSPAGTSDNGGGGTGGTAGPGGGSGGNRGNVDPTNTNNCGAKTFAVTNIPPDVLIVMDKSGSMNQLADGTPCTADPMMCKWPQMTTALNQVVTATQATVRWGLKYFPDNGGCRVGDMAAVPVAPNNGAAVSMSIGTNMPNGSTPTRIAVDTGAAYLAGLMEPNPKFILLATDGLPNCGGGQNGGGGGSDGPGAVMAVKNAAAMGIPTFVVGIATGADAEATLNMMAMEGGQPRATDPKYYPVTSAADLTSALTMITGRIASCTFGLGGAPPNPNSVSINAGSMKIPKDTTHMNGWDFGTGNQSIILYGSYCDTAKAGKLGDLQALFGCPPVP